MASVKTQQEFHPVVAAWFADRFGEPTAPQAAGWKEIASGRNTLIAAPTGSGKTLAAFLWSINRLVEQHLAGALPDTTQVIYVSPLKALGNDIERNLREPLRAIQDRLQEMSMAVPEIRVAVRSGDTPATDRARMLRHPPHILITTPESLFILLTAEGSRKYLSTARTIIVDEIHAVAGDKRGAHLALSLERLDALVGTPIQRIGLSATQKPIEEVARLLVGAGRGCSIVDVGHRRAMDLSVFASDIELGPIATHEIWATAYEDIVRQIQRHRATLVFVSTRRAAERVAFQLGERLGHDRVATHHGSLSRETRLKAEAQLKAGEVPVVVATASLELGIDIGHVDLVCHVGPPRSIATMLQRIGRSGHWLGAIPKGILYPLTRDELIQTAAGIRALRAGELDKVEIFRKPLDILAQQIVAMAASEELKEDDLFDLVRRAHPFRDLERSAFDDIVEMLSEGIATERGRRSAYLHRDWVYRVLRGRRGARLAAITSGGAIPDIADYDVIEEPEGTRVGSVHEDFAIESMAGDVFLLGNNSWRIRRVESGKVRVENAHGAPSTIPFWIGEAPARTPELSAAVSQLRTEIEARLSEPTSAVEWLRAETSLENSAAEQVVAYVADTRAVLGTVPSQQTVVAERFFDEAGGMQLVMHTPFGGRINRAWGLALRKRFCVTFDFELQAAATDDGVVISLGEQHSFPLESVFRMVRPLSLQTDLIQAVLPSPMFTNRWRWNAERFLALLRYERGRRVPMPIQRMRADDLMAAVFPQQAQCVDNRSGPVEPPDHPLVNETIDNCLREAMDIDGFTEILAAMDRGEIRTVAVETPAPSPMSHEILNANPYAFLDDAPLEERRARAVSLRRTDPDLATGIGALDPEAIAMVRGQAWPDVRDAEDLHDALLTLIALPANDVEPWREFADELIAARRATLASWMGGRALVAAERIRALELALGPTALEPAIAQPPGAREFTEDEAVSIAVKGWTEALGPTTANELSRRLGFRLGKIESALAELEGRGAVLRGRFTSADPEETEWCDRRLLARIHRYTLARIRQEIEPVSASDLLRFLFQWQHVAPSTQLHGREGVATVIRQLQGLELPAPAWESWVFPGRLAKYDSYDLEQLCLSGQVAWGRLSSRLWDDGLDPADAATASPRRRRHVRPGRQAPLAFVLREDLPWLLASSPDAGTVRRQLSPDAEAAFDFLERHGASFLSEIARGTGRMPAMIEDALWELVAWSLVAGDGVAGLRALLEPEHKRVHARRHLRALPGGRAAARLMPVGRWSRWREADEASEEERNERFARQLLQRYGVMFRELLARETQAPPWRTLLTIYRRLEARGEIRGGHFVQGFVGEQFALGEAIEALRALRRAPAPAQPVLVHVGDPLNLVGILTPGSRISPYSNQVVAYRNGAPVDVGPLGAVKSRLQLSATE
ncbi:MAG: DEAD/DEAH box helicase [Chloroflexi bacterium]|nr:DEAD/DEAH box helicase [Chloroflexota bacterium]